MGRFIMGHIAHQGHEFVSIQISHLPDCHDPAVPHHCNLFRALQDLIQDVRDHNNAQARFCGSSNELKELLGHGHIQGRRRLIEYDQAQRIVRDGEGSGDLNHLTLADGQVAHEVFR